MRFNNEGYEECYVCNEDIDSEDDGERCARCEDAYFYEKAFIEEMGY